MQVTGGSAGAGGKAAALAFAENGARVAVMVRRRKRLDAVVELPEGLAVVGDLMSTDDCSRTVAETVAAFGGLDVLVNNGRCGSVIAGWKACWMYQLFHLSDSATPNVERVFPQVATVSHELNCAGGALWDGERLIGSYNTRAVGF